MKRTVLPLFLFLLTITGMGMLAARMAPPVYAQLEANAGTSQDNVGTSACKFVTDSTQHSKCTSCFSKGGAWTALGCLGGETPNDFIASLIRLGTGLGGGVAFLLILFSGFQRIMSAGNPEKLHEAKDLMTAAISGLLLIIFSIFLLRLIGVDILRIPGLN